MSMCVCVFIIHDFLTSTAELAGIIVAAALVTAAIIAIAVWLHFRRKKSKSQALNVELSHQPQTVQTQFNLGFVMETDAKTMGNYLFSISSSYFFLLFFFVGKYLLIRTIITEMSQLE